MIEVTPDAEQYFRRLIDQQNIDGLGLRLRALCPGTPAGDVELTFCPPGEQGEDDQRIDCDGFAVHVSSASWPWLEDASIDFRSEETGGQLTIKAPGLKGHQPGADAPIEERVSWVLEAEVTPMVAQHGGQVGLVEVTADNQAVLSFGGGCQGCGMVDVTLKQGIERILCERIPELQGVKDATDHSAGDNPYYAPEERRGESPVSG